MPASGRPGPGRSRRAWGWHPLTDTWAARVVADAGIRPGELVLDIGAGTGAITRHLIAAGARVPVLQRAAVRRHVQGVHRCPRRCWRFSAGLAVPREAFRPPPWVDSGVLVVRRR